MNSVYSHKTDVWAFGVTVWEILSFGEKPYKDIPTNLLLERLLEGERLPKPNISTLDVQIICIKCWTVVPEKRPSFADLASEFGMMLRDPGRYLVIPGDEFLRLPDYTHDDERRLMNDDSGPEELINAEEYTNPGIHRFDHSALMNNKVIYRLCHEMFSRYSVLIIFRYTMSELIMVVALLLSTISNLDLTLNNLEEPFQPSCSCSIRMVISWPIDVDQQARNIVLLQPLQM